MRKLFKRTKKNRGKRLLAAALSFALLFSLVCSSGVAIYATDAGTPETEAESDSLGDISVPAAEAVEESIAANLTGEIDAFDTAAEPDNEANNEAENADNEVYSAVAKMSEGGVKESSFDTDISEEELESSILYSLLNSGVEGISDSDEAEPGIAALAADSPVGTISDSDEAVPGIAALAADSPAQFEFHYICSESGWAGFGMNLFDDKGKSVSATVTGYGSNTEDDRYTLTVDMPYTFTIESFLESFEIDGGYTFLYATVTDPNYGDEEHEFDVWDGEAKVGAQELYGSEENPVVSVTINGTAKEENPNYPTLGADGIHSKTWHFTLTYEDGDFVTIPIYGNKDGGLDNGSKYCPLFLQINLYFEGPEGVVLNLGNGNGSYSDGDYTGSKDSVGENVLRYETENLNEYADEDRNVTIHLPSDADLDAEFTVADAVGEEGDEDYLPAVTVPLGKEQAYDYRLIGWFDIATGDYYDVSGGSVEAEINLSDDNVFYADWIAESYDYGSSSDEGLREDTVSTSDYVTLRMFDYNELFNMYSAALTQDGTDGETWKDSESLYSEPLLSRTDLSPIGSSFIFHNNGADGTTNTNVYVLSDPNPAKWNLWTRNGVWDGQDEYDFVLDAEKYWNITSPDSTILGMLYDTEEESLGVHYVGDGDYLFWVDDNGYYTYDSAVSGAAYNQSEGRFYVYDDNANAFFPYNDHGDAISSGDGTTNYWFGMSMEVNLYLPSATSDGSATNPVNQINGEDMVFDFSGDDDIMIFVDGDLAVDMSGIHGHSYSRINFSDGTVTYSMRWDNDNNAPDTSGAKKYEVRSLDLSAGTHTLQVFYMERGASESNLKVQFNVVPAWYYETGSVQTVTAEKVWQDTAGTLITDSEELSELLDGADPSIEVGLFDLLPEAVEAETDDEGNVITEAVFGYTKNETDGTYSVSYTNDNGIGYAYVFTPASGEGDDAVGASLLITETFLENGDTQTVTVTYDQTDDEGRVLDEDGYVVAWLETDEEGNEILHLRVDVQTLSEENDWSYAWELLDPDGTYEAIELTESSLYQMSSSSETLTVHKYWSVIGDDELEEILESGSQTPIILTEAAQEAESTIGDTKEAYGWVIVADGNGVTTKQVAFSQISVMEQLPREEGQFDTYEGTYGLTSQAEIESLGSGALWYPVDAGTTHLNLDGTEMDGMYLYCESGDGSTKYYLTLEETDDGSGTIGYTLAVTTDESLKSELYYDALGELLISSSDGTAQVRIEIDADGAIQIDSPEWEAALDDVRLYTLTDAASTGLAFTVTNTLTRPVPTTEKLTTGGSTPNELTTGGSTPNELTVGGAITEEGTGAAVAPKTDDANMPIRYALLMILAGAVLAGFGVRRYTVRR